MDPDNSPAWDLQQCKLKEGVPAKLPLFVNKITAHKCADDIQSEVLNGCSYTLPVTTPTRSVRPATYVWINAKYGTSSKLIIYSVSCYENNSFNL